MTVRAHHRSLATLSSLALLLLPACSGIQKSQGEDTATPPFVFRALDLKQQDLFGSPRWSLSSPEARYDIRRHVAQADRPQGVIYRRGKPAYRLSATSGTVLNEGQVVLLEGRIRVEQLGKRPLLIRAERARWFPGRNRLEVDRRPEVLDPANRIHSRRALFAFDTHQLTLLDKPQLEHWSQRFEPSKDIARGQPEVVLQVLEATWNIEAGDLSTKGPVQGRRTVPGRQPGQPVQTLSASRLDGNTVKQEFWLRAPVRFQDPLDGTEFLAADLRFDLQSRMASTASPFTGSRGDMQASGQRVQVDGSQDSLTIPSGCRLLKGGDSLQADSCSWNWNDQSVQALGNVVLRRQEHQQFSRGGRLSGRLGDTGFLTLTNPGGRVVSRLYLPHRPGSLRPQIQRPRPAADPIRL